MKLYAIDYSKFGNWGRNVKKFPKLLSRSKYLELCIGADWKNEKFWPQNCKILTTFWPKHLKIPTSFWPKLLNFVCFLTKMTQCWFEINHFEISRRVCFFKLLEKNRFFRVFSWIIGGFFKKRFFIKNIEPFNSK